MFRQFVPLLMIDLWCVQSSDRQERPAPPASFKTPSYNYKSGLRIEWIQAGIIRPNYTKLIIRLPHVSEPVFTARTNETSVEVPGLKECVLYTYQVIAYYKDDETKESDKVYFEVPGKPASLTIVWVPGVHNSKLEWNAPGHCRSPVKFGVDIREQGGLLRKINTEQRFITIPTMNLSGIYEVMVRAKNDYGISRLSRTINLTQYESDLIATVEGEQLFVKWLVPFSRSHLTLLNLRSQRTRKTVVIQVKTVAGEERYPVEKCSNYQITLSSLTRIGKFKLLEYLNYTTPLEAPDKPRHVSVFLESEVPQLSWTLHSDCPADNFTIHLYESGNLHSTYVTNQSTFWLPRLNDCNIYSVYISASNAAGNSVWAEKYTFINHRPIGQPETLAINWLPGYNRSKILWNNPPSCRQPEFYVVNVTSTNGDSIVLRTIGTSTEVVLPSLSVNTIYNATVSAQGLTGHGILSTSIELNPNNAYLNISTKDSEILIQWIVPVSSNYTHVLFFVREKDNVKTVKLLRFLAGEYSIPFDSDYSIELIRNYSVFKGKSVKKLHISRKAYQSTGMGTSEDIVYHMDTMGFPDAIHWMLYIAMAVSLLGCLAVIYHKCKSRRPETSNASEQNVYVPHSPQQEGKRTESCRCAQLPHI